MTRGEDPWENFSDGGDLMRQILISAVMMWAVIVASEPIQSARQLEDYDRSGSYQIDIDKSVKLCNQKVEQFRRQSPRHEKEAAVFDIDETVLSNISLIRKSQYRFTNKDFLEQIADSHPLKIESSMQLARRLRKEGVAIFFITGRTESMYSLAASQLAEVGMSQSDYQAIFCAPEGESIGDFKQRSRDRIVGMGYKIILSISDQDSDLQGDNLGVVCKLPNPFYKTG